MWLCDLAGKLGWQYYAACEGQFIGNPGAASLINAATILVGVAVVGGGLYLLKQTGILDFVLSFIGHMLDFMRQSISWLVSSSPSWMKIILFLLLIVILAIPIGMFLDLNYVCYNGERREYDNGMIGGIITYVGNVINTAIFKENSSLENETRIDILNSTHPSPVSEDVTISNVVGVNCQGNSPQILLFNAIPIFDYKILFLLMLITVVLGIANNSRR